MDEQRLILIVEDDGATRAFLAEDIAAEQEASRLRDEMQTTRTSSRAPAGEIYEAKDRPRRL